MIGIISSIFAIIDSYDMSPWMLTAFNFSNDISARHISSISNIVVLIATTRTVIPTFNTCHLYLPKNLKRIPS